MENNNSRRSMHSKEKFLEGNRQKWLVIFLLAGAVILFLDALGKVQHIESYLTFLTFLSGSFILGYSGTETMKLFRVTSNVTESTQEIKQETKQRIINETLTHNAKEDGYKI